MKQREFVVDKRHALQRLDLAVALEFNDLSRNFIKKQIENNLVTINGEVEFKANYKVQQGDKVAISYEENLDESDKLIPTKIDLNIIYEDENIIAVNKESGIVVHPATGNWTDTVMNGIAYYYKDQQNVGQAIRSGLIHRLDKETSGLLLIAKNNEALWYYSKLFAQREVEKIYLVLVQGKLPVQLSSNSEMEVSSYIYRNPKNRKKMSATLVGRATNLPPDARIAKSIFKLVASEGDVHLCEVKLLTGRTHQIRVHSVLIGLKVLGDDKYGIKADHRMMLHSYKIKLKKLDGKILELTANPDKEFLSIIEKYGLKEKDF